MKYAHLATAVGYSYIKPGSLQLLIFQGIVAHVRARLLINLGAEA